MKAPLRRLAYRLAERLNKTAAEVLDGVSVDELLDWQEYFATEHSEAEVRFATLMTKLDQVHWRKGQARPSIKRRLRPLKRYKPGRRNLEEVRKSFDAALGFGA